MRPAGRKSEGNGLPLRSRHPKTFRARTLFASRGCARVPVALAAGAARPPSVLVLPSASHREGRLSSRARHAALVRSSTLWYGLHLPVAPAFLWRSDRAKKAGGPKEDAPHYQILRFGGSRPPLRSF